MLAAKRQNAKGTFRINKNKRTRKRLDLYNCDGSLHYFGFGQHFYVSIKAITTKTTEIKIFRDLSCFRGFV